MLVRVPVYGHTYGDGCVHVDVHAQVLVYVLVYAHAYALASARARPRKHAHEHAHTHPRASRALERSTHNKNFEGDWGWAQPPAPSQTD